MEQKTYTCTCFSGLIHTGRACVTPANGTYCCQWECSHCSQATSKEKRSNLRACCVARPVWIWPQGHWPITKLDLHLDHVVEHVIFSHLREAKTPYWNKQSATRQNWNLAGWSACAHHNRCQTVRDVRTGIWVLLATRAIFSVEATRPLILGKVAGGFHNRVCLDCMFPFQRDLERNTRCLRSAFSFCIMYASNIVGDRQCHSYNVTGVSSLRSQ